MTKLEPLTSRREFLVAGGVSGIALGLGGCDRLSESPTFQRLLEGRRTHLPVQRTLLGAGARARIHRGRFSGVPANGSQDPKNLRPGYGARCRRYSPWRSGSRGSRDERPMSFSLADLRALNARTQITRHDCVEGWSASAIGPAAAIAVLDLVGLGPEARFSSSIARMNAALYRGPGSYYEASTSSTRFIRRLSLLTMNGHRCP